MAPSSPTFDRDPVLKNVDYMNGFSGPSSITLDELGDIWVADAKRQISLRPKSPSLEERMKGKQERYRKSLIIALNTYAKQNNMQLNELEIVEEIGRNQVHGPRCRLYVHSNFLVKGLDGKTTLFFAETGYYCTREEDVVLCTPLEEISYGHSFECDDRAKQIKHPSGGGYMGGLDEVIIRTGDMESDEDCYM